MTYQFSLSSLNATTFEELWDGMVISLEITGVGVAAGVVCGSLLAMMRLSSIRLFRLFAEGYVTLCRSIPLVMVLLWFFLIIPQLLESAFGLTRATDLRMVSSLIAFALFEAAYFSEIIRAGIQGVPRGQIFAARALGMTYWQSMLIIILPQAFRNMIPLLVLQGIILFQDTSLVYISALSDFFGRAYSIGQRDGRIVEMLLLAGFIYFAICFTASRLVRLYPRRHAS